MSGNIVFCKLKILCLGKQKKYKKVSIETKILILIAGFFLKVLKAHCFTS